MGLADRDYARTGPRGGGFGVGGGRGGWGGGGGRGGWAGGLSFNAWLIIVNVAVFVIGGTLLGRAIPVSAGVGYWNTVVVDRGMVAPVTEEILARAVTLESIQLPDPEQPGNMFYHPIVDPTIVSQDRSGNLLVDPVTRRIVGEVGRRRFTYQPVLHAIGHFSTGKAFGELQIWRFITFQFLHADYVHLLFNMLGLWFVGGMVEARLGPKRYAAFYLLCGAAGAGLYLLLNLLGYGFGAAIPGVLFSDPYTPLVGASAGVFGILLAAAALYPREIVLVMFVLPMQLRTAVYLFTAFAALNLLRGSSNAGGEAAHIGGAIAGAYLIRRPHMLGDVVEFFRFSRRSKARRPAKSGRWANLAGASDRAGESDQAAVDQILEKVHASGIDSLTEREKRILQRASGRGGT